MRRPCLALLFACLSGLGAEAAVQAPLTGRVLEAAGAQPVPGARVTAAGLAAEAGVGGAFSLSLPPGSWLVVVTAEGFLTETAQVEIRPGVAPAPLEILLADRSRFREQVEVTARSDGAAKAPAELPVRPMDVLAVAGGAENVFRALQTLPGVAAPDEFGSRISVRGGGPDENLTVMDGVEIHNPYRIFGLISAFNPETVRSFDLYTAGFGVKHGDRLSSLLVVENRAGVESSGLNGSAAVSLTDGNAIVEGKLPGRAKGSWLVTGRRTYYDLVANRLVGTDLPAFADVQAKAVWEPAAGHRVSAFALLSRESAASVFEGDRAGEQGALDSSARNDVAALAYQAALGERGSSRTILSWYRNTDELGVDAQFRQDSKRSNAPEDDVGFGQAMVDFARRLVVEDLALRQDLAWQASATHLFEAGFEAHWLDTAVSWRIAGDRNPTAANGSSIRGGAGLPDRLDSAYDTTRLGAWLQDRAQVGPRLVLEPGLRFDRSSANGRSGLSPRLGLSLAIDDRTRLRAALGLFTQSPGYEKLIQADYFVDLSGAGLGLLSERSVHVLLGLEREVGAGVTARVEGYYKHFDRLIIGRLENEAEREARMARYRYPPELQSSVPGDPIVTSIPSNDGRGRAWGFDVYLVKRPTAAGRLSGWGSYTYGVAEREQYGRSMPFDYDRRHAFSLVAAYRLSPKLELSATGRALSGFPRTPVLGLVVAPREVTESDTTLYVPDRDAEGRLVYTTDLGPVSNLNTARLPAFLRLDLRITFRPKGGEGRWELYLDVINVLDRENAGQIDVELEHDPTSKQPRMVERRTAAIPFLPSLGVRFRF